MDPALSRALQHIRIKNGLLNHRANLLNHHTRKQH